MHMLYNSDSFAVVAFEIPHGPVAEGEPDARAARRLRDRRQVREEGHLPRGRRRRELQGRRDGADGRRAERGGHGRIHRPLHRGDAPAARPALSPGRRRPGLRLPERRARPQVPGRPVDMRLRRRTTSPPARSFVFRARRVHGCRAGDQFRGAFGDAGGVDAPSRPRRSARWPRTWPSTWPAGSGSCAPAAGGLWLFGAAIGAVARHLVVADHRHRRRAAGVPARLRRRRLAHRLGGGAGGRPGRARRRQRQDRHSRAGRPRRRSRSASASSPPTSLSLNALGLQPGIDWQMLALVAAVSRRLRRLHDGARRLLPRRRPQQAADRALADDRGAGARRHPGREPAARRRRRRARRADRLAPRRADRLDDARPVRLGRLDRPAGGRPDPLDPRGAPAPVAAPRRERAAAPLVPRRPDAACRTG